MRRHLSATRPPPDAIAVRRHFPALIVADLEVTYDDFDIRTWFGRPRQRLGGTGPARLVAGRRRAEPNARACRQLCILTGDANCVTAHRPALCPPARAPAPIGGAEERAGGAAPRLLRYTGRRPSPWHLAAVDGAHVSSSGECEERPSLRKALNGHASMANTDVMTVARRLPTAELAAP